MSIKEDAEPAIGLVSVLNRVFAQLDANHDRVLQPAELDHAVVEGCFAEEDAAAVAILKASFLEIKELHKEGWFAKRNGITLADLLFFEQILLHEREQPQKTEKDSLLSVTWWLWKRIKELEHERRELFGTRDEMSSIRPEAIRQGRVGDCYFLAALGSITITNPQLIKRIIKTESSGAEGKVYTVTFPGAREHPVTVHEPSPVELALYAQLTRYGTWPAVLEKAYGQYLGNHGYARATVPQDGTHAAQSVYEAFDLLTGQIGHWVHVPSTSDEDLANMLTSAFHERLASAASTYSSSGEFTQDGIPSSHAYSVLGFERSHMRIKLRNPWGNSSHAANSAPLANDDGVFVMDMTAFRRNFLAIYYEDWLPDAAYDG